MKFTPEETEEIIFQAMQDEIPLESLRLSHNMTPDEVRHFMKMHLSKRSFIAWQKRVRGSVMKHPTTKSIKHDK